MSRATLATLDSSLYPQVWAQHTYLSAHELLIALLNNDLTLTPLEFTKQLLANNIYQDWINATVFGRYIQRSFAAFYQQSEDSFNMELPALFRHELMRHAQYLPEQQTLFVAGDIPKSARAEKLFTTTVNPATVVIDAQALAQNRSMPLIINQITVASKQVIGFPIRHNKRTSERTRNEVLILDFNALRLVKEDELETSIDKQSGTSVSTLPTLLRYYDLC